MRAKLDSLRSLENFSLKVWGSNLHQHAAIVEANANVY